MNILYDHQIFSLQDRGGISRYYTNLINGFKYDHNIRLPIWLSNNIYLKEFDQIGIKVDKFLPNLQWKGKNNLIYRRNKYKTLKNSNLENIFADIDIVHLTMFDPYLIKFLKKREIPWVFTIYDLNHKTQAKKYIGMCDYRNKIELLADQADGIITVSNATKKEFTKFYPDIEIKKIKTIHHSIDLLKIKNIYDKQTSSIIDGNYIFFVGDRSSPHKNFINFIKKIKDILNKDLKLVCLGKTLNLEEKKILDRYKISDFVQTISGGDNIKYNLYRYATCFVYPSIAEGFGIPILEARASGCPVICTDIEIFEEVGEQAVLYVDKDTLANTTSHILALLDKKNNLKKDIVFRGHQRVEVFDQKYEINQTIEFYKHIINKYHKKVT